jgi:hypothetical protein
MDVPASKDRSPRYGLMASLPYFCRLPALPQTSTNEMWLLAEVNIRQLVHVEDIGILFHTICVSEYYIDPSSVVEG